MIYYLLISCSIFDKKNDISLILFKKLHFFMKLSLYIGFWLVFLCFEGGFRRKFVEGPLALVQ